MSSIVADTHALIWYLLDPPMLSVSATRAFRDAETAGARIYIPSICMVEVIYLVEHNRVPADALRLIREALNKRVPFTLAVLDLSVIEALSSIPRAAVPDMPDRIIGATALSLKIPLVTRDHRLQSSAVSTIW